MHGETVKFNEGLFKVQKLTADSEENYKKVNKYSKSSRRDEIADTSQGNSGRQKEVFNK
jgi:hypothetical protein